MRKTCEYEIPEEFEDTSTARRSEEEKGRRRNFEKDRQKAEEMDKISRVCMKSGLEAL